MRSNIHKYCSIECTDSNIENLWPMNPDLYKMVGPRACHFRKFQRGIIKWKIFHIFQSETNNSGDFGLPDLWNTSKIWLLVDGYPVKTVRAMQENDPQRYIELLSFWVTPTAIIPKNIRKLPASVLDQVWSGAACCLLPSWICRIL